MKYVIQRLKRFCGYLAGFVFFIGGLLKLVDPVEKNWPLSTPVCVEDAESGECILFEGSKSAQQKVNSRLQLLHEQQLQMCRNAKVDLVEIESGQNVLTPLINFFNRRKHRISYRTR